MKTNFPELKIFEKNESLKIPQKSSFSGNTFINEYQDKIDLLPSDGDGKLANRFIEVNRFLLTKEQLQNADAESYSSQFATYWAQWYRAQLAYYMNI